MSLTSILKENAGVFGPVVPFSPANDKLLLLDFTDANDELTASILQDTNLFTHHITEKLAAAGARYGIGGYGEHRTVYSRSLLFGAPEVTSHVATTPVTAVQAEPRRLHLGVDIWGRPHTAVKAPFDGLVHSYAFIDGFGDYGGAIILTHQLSGQTFYTLYGHLSLNSIKNLQEGEHIVKGEIFAEFGIPSENGQWPPHLHFQVIEDLEGWKGDYPGVCKYSEREKWLGNCPDPDLILQLNQYVS
jgi:murein DD-endopeptidase MepM/ murein hydrolase activator NlpD